MWPGACVMAYGTPEAITAAPRPRGTATPSLRRSSGDERLDVDTGVGERLGDGPRHGDRAGSVAVHADAVRAYFKHRAVDRDQLAPGDQPHHPLRDDDHWLKHTLAYRQDDGTVKLEYKDVKMGAYIPMERKY